MADDEWGPLRGTSLPAHVPDDIRALGRGGAARSFRQYGGGAVAASIGLPPMQDPGTLLRYPPEIYPRAEAQDFRRDGRAPGLTNVNTPVVLPGGIAGALGLGLSFQVSANNVAVVRDVSVLVLGMTASTDIRFRLKQDGSLIPGWDLTINPRVATSVELSELPDSTVVRIREGALIELEIEVIDAGTYQAGAVFHGWQWPSNLGA